MGIKRIEYNKLLGMYKGSCGKYKRSETAMIRSRGEEN